jgi:hypothetical protein
MPYGAPFQCSVVSDGVGAARAISISNLDSALLCHNVACASVSMSVFERFFDSRKSPSLVPADPTEREKHFAQAALQVRFFFLMFQCSAEIFSFSDCDRISLSSKIQHVWFVA